jgi:hypothetical protein
MVGPAQKSRGIVEGLEKRSLQPIARPKSVTNRSGKMLVTIIDDAHLMEMENLRKLRLLLEDFPKNHNLILIRQVELLSSLDLAINQDT